MHILQPSNSTPTEMQAVQDTYVRMGQQYWSEFQKLENIMDKLFIHITEYIHIRVCARVCEMKRNEYCYTQQE